MEILKIKHGPVPGFDEAYRYAREEALKHLSDPMALSWPDRRTGRHSPDVYCCQEEGKESWEIYAESRGGKLRIEVGEEYVFIFREGLL